MSLLLLEITPHRVRFVGGDVDTDRRYLRKAAPYKRPDFHLSKGKTLGVGGGKLSASLPSGYRWNEPGYTDGRSFKYPSGVGWGVTV